MKKEYRFAGVSVGYDREYHSLREWEYSAPRGIKLCSFFNSWQDSRMAADKPSSLFNLTRNTQHVLPISTQNSEPGTNSPIFYREAILQHCEASYTPRCDSEHTPVRPRTILLFPPTIPIFPFPSRSASGRFLFASWPMNTILQKYFFPE